MHADRPAIQERGTSGVMPSEHQCRGVSMRPCLQPGCPRPTERTRCAIHERQWQAERNRRRGDDYGAEYQRARRELLAAATACAICGLPPTHDDPLTADHVVPRAHGGGAAGNLRAAHRSCNSRRGATVRQ